MRIVLHHAVPGDGLWCVSADNTTVLFRSHDGPADLLRQLADLYEEDQPISEQEWEQARQRLMKA
jgi:hypothetical protein